MREDGQRRRNHQADLPAFAARAVDGARRGVGRSISAPASDREPSASGRRDPWPGSARRFGPARAAAAVGAKTAAADRCEGPRRSPCAARRPFECSSPRGHLVQRRAKGEDVAARVGLATGELLGRHVRKRAEHRTVGGERPAPGETVDSASRSGVDLQLRERRSRAASRPTFVNITLPGLRSRWTSPRRCA